MINNLLSLSSTNLDIFCSDDLEAEVGQNGSTSVSAATFYEIVKRLPSGSEIHASLSEEDSTLTLKCGRSKFNLTTISPDDFPKISHDDLNIQFVLSATELKRMIDKTKFAISNEETRYYLNGVFLHQTQKNSIDILRAVATDGHRLARVEMPLPEGAGQMPSVIVPRKAVVEIRKLIEDNESDVSISLSESKLCCKIGDTVLTTKLIDGTFPDYERVIPTGNDKLMNVNCRELAEVVDRVATISTEKSRSVKLQLKTRMLVLSANSPESGTAREELEVQYDSEDLEIGFNSRYLLDITNQIEGENIEFSLADPGSPTIVRDQDDNTSLYVLMPMRV